tara:strand:- start:1575 stop:1781 length:207 start_codon:yes stop_codon:yes gene_type:complete
MIEFKVVSTPKPDRFEQEITKMLNDGWSLHGTTTMTQSGMMAQSLTRESKTPMSQRVATPKKVKASED